MSHEFTAASRAASADELRATLSRLPVLRAGKCALLALPLITNLLTTISSEKVN